MILKVVIKNACMPKEVYRKNYARKELSFAQGGHCDQHKPRSLPSQIISPLLRAHTHTHTLTPAVRSWIRALTTHGGFQTGLPEPRMKSRPVIGNLHRDRAVHWQVAMTRHMRSGVGPVLVLPPRRPIPEHRFRRLCLCRRRVRSRCQPWKI